MANRDMVTVSVMGFSFSGQGFRASGLEAGDLNLKSLAFKGSFFTQAHGNT